MKKSTKFLAAAASVVITLILSPLFITKRIEQKCNSVKE